MDSIYYDYSLHILFLCNMSHMTCSHTCYFYFLLWKKMWLVEYSIFILWSHDLRVIYLNGIFIHLLFIVNLFKFNFIHLISGGSLNRYLETFWGNLKSRRNQSFGKVSVAYKDSKRLRSGEIIVKYWRLYHLKKSYKRD